MIRDNTYLKNHSDDVLEELWQAKDYYSLSCNSDFRELVKKSGKTSKTFVISEKDKFMTEKINQQDSLEIKLLSLLNNGCGERKIHSFLKQHSEIVVIAFNRAWNFYVCIPEFWLGNDFRADFFILSAHSINWNAIFIELKSPTDKLYNKDRTKSKKLRLAEKQIAEWQEWIRANESNLRGSFAKILDKENAPAIWFNDVPGHKGYCSGASEIADIRNCVDYSYHIVIGRSSSLLPEEREDRMRDGAMCPTEVVTYDRLLTMAKRIDENKKFLI